MASHGSIGSTKSRPWRPAGREPGPRCTANRSLTSWRRRMGPGRSQFSPGKTWKIDKIHGKSMGKSCEFDLENHESSWINIWHIWSWWVFLYMVFLLKMICLSVSWDFFTLWPGIFPFFHSFVARGRFAGTSTLKMTRSSVRGWLKRGRQIQCAPWAPKRDLQGVFCFFIWLVVNQPLWKNMKVNGKDYPIYYGK